MSDEEERLLLELEKIVRGWADWRRNMNAVEIRRAREILVELDHWRGVEEKGMGE